MLLISQRRGFAARVKRAKSRTKSGPQGASDTGKREIGTPRPRAGKRRTRGTVTQSPAVPGVAASIFSFSSRLATGASPGSGSRVSSWRPRSDPSTLCRPCRNANVARRREDGGGRAAQRRRRGRARGSRASRSGSVRCCWGSVGRGAAGCRCACARGGGGGRNADAGACADSAACARLRACCSMRWCARGRCRRTMRTTPSR